MNGGAGQGLATLVRGFRGTRCLVVGDALLDVFERGRVARLAPDAPVPVITNLRRESCPGGAANVAANLALLGARVTLPSPPLATTSRATTSWRSSPRRG